MPSGSSTRAGWTGSSRWRATRFFQATICSSRSTPTTPSAAVNSLIRRLSPSTPWSGLP